MIKNAYMPYDSLQNELQKNIRYENQHKNFVLPHDKFIGESNYQNSYIKKDVNYNDLRAVIQKPKGTIENKQFQGQSNYNQTYKKNQNFVGRPNKFKQTDNIVASTQRFNGVSQYNDRLKGQLLSSKTQRYALPKNQIFPKGSFEGVSNYNNEYVASQITRNTQIRPQGELKIGQSRFQGNSSYFNDYSRNNNVSKPEKIVQKDNQVMPRGNFNGESTYNNNYGHGPASIQVNRKFVPQSELKVGGTFQGSSSYNNSYTGMKSEKTQQFRPQQEWKMEGNFEGNSSYLNDFKKHQHHKRSSMALMPNNQFMPIGKFQTNTSYQASYLPNEQTRQRQYRPEGQLKIGQGSFDGSSSYLRDFKTRDYQPQLEKHRPIQNQVMPKGRFAGQSIYHENYMGGQAEKNQSFKPKGQLQVGGKFQGVSNYTGQYSQKKGLKAERTPLPVNQVMPEGRFDGQSNYTDTYIPSVIQKRQKIVMMPQLTVGGQFEGNSTYAENYQFSPAKKEPYTGESNNGPRWNKKASRWE